MNMVQLLIVLILGTSFAILVQYMVSIRIKDIEKQFSSLAKDYTNQAKLLIKIQNERDYYKAKVKDYEEDEEEE